MASIHSSANTENTAYAPRNVINAPEIKARIKDRSLQRQDAPEISEWLLNHFCRYVIGNFAAPEAVKTIHNAEEARVIFAQNAALPDWLTRRFAAKETLFWIDPQSAPLIALETTLLEFLQTRRGTALEGKLMKINCAQALALFAAEHRAFAARQLSGFRTHSPEAVRVVCASELGIFVELLPQSPKLRAEMAYESQMMRHCVGQFADKKELSGGYGEHYAQGCAAGKMRLFSFRVNGEPKITISVFVQEADLKADSNTGLAASSNNPSAGTLQIDQIKGKQNRPPIARYRQSVRLFLNSPNFAGQFSNHLSPDLAELAIVPTDLGWEMIEHIRSPKEQLRVINTLPHFADKLPELCPAAQWLLAAKMPELLPKVTLFTHIQTLLKVGA